MFGLSMTELLIVLVVALLVIGPKQLPQVAKTLGKAMRDFRRASDDLRDTFEREVMDEPRPKIRQDPAAIAASAPTGSSSASSESKEQKDSKGPSSSTKPEGESSAQADARATSANAPPKALEGDESSGESASSSQEGSASGDANAQAQAPESGKMRSGGEGSA